MISFDEQQQVFHLKNNRFSYVFSVARGRYLLHRYWGRPLRAFRGSAELPALDRAFSPQPGDYENERTFSLDVLPQELSLQGHGDFRIPSLGVTLPDGTDVVDLFYDGYRILRGKPALAGLPALYAREDEAETLEVTLRDPRGRLAAGESLAEICAEGAWSICDGPADTDEATLRGYKEAVRDRIYLTESVLPSRELEDGRYVIHEI